MKKYQANPESLIDVLACHLMPAHFHFLIYIVSAASLKIKKNIGIRNETLPKIEIIRTRFSSIEEFIEFSNNKISDDDLNAII